MYQADMANTNVTTENKIVIAGRARAYGVVLNTTCLLYTSPSPRDGLLSRMPSSA